MTRRRFNPALADNRARDRELIEQTKRRAEFVTARIESHGADGLASGWKATTSSDGG